MSSLNQLIQMGGDHLAKGLGGPARYRFGSIGGTAEAQARVMSIRAPTLRSRVLQAFADGPATPEQILAVLRSAGVATVLTTIRSRCSELYRLGVIQDSGERGRAEGGGRAIVWRLSTPEEFALYLARQAADAEHGEASE